MGRGGRWNWGEKREGEETQGRKGHTHGNVEEALLGTQPSMNINITTSEGEDWYCLGRFLETGAVAESMIKNGDTKI